MKKGLILIVLFLVFSFSGCENNNENDIQKIDSNIEAKISESDMSIRGKYQLYKTKEHQVDEVIDVTLEEAFEEYFTDTTWTFEDGEKEYSDVIFSGAVWYKEKIVIVEMKFLLKAVEIIKLKSVTFDGEEQSRIVIQGLFKDIIDRYERKIEKVAEDFKSRIPEGRLDMSEDYKEIPEDEEQAADLLRTTIKDKYTKGNVRIMYLKEEETSQIKGYSFKVYEDYGGSGVALGFFLVDKVTGDIYEMEMTTGEYIKVE